MQALAAVFAFRTIPTTVLVVLVYLAIFTSVLLTDDLPTPPKSARSDLDQAYANLHRIAARPHPYNSHANDHVRSFILSSLRHLAVDNPHVQIHDDRVSNASWAVSTSHGVYFEGNNILVKVEGTDPGYETHGGVLFSAHYDSVSTAPGVTDDGMGVAVLLDLVKYFARTRPKRTAVFNINNGEEDGLHGAHVFMTHPWARITNKFLNLEGAAAGGRPILFRATSTTTVRSFQGKDVRHPHGNVIASDAFARGVIRSGTDYSVYTQDFATGTTMDGLDFAFYKGRSKYHTKYDSVSGTQGGKKALWAMMETARGVGESLLNNVVSKEAHEPGNAVYFDLFGRTMIVFPLRGLLAYDIALTVCGPVIIILLVAVQYAVIYNRRARQNGIAHNHRRDTTWESFSRWFMDLDWLRVTWTWSKFWLCLVISFGLQALLVVGYIKLNPFIVYSHPLLVLTSNLSLAYLSIVLFLGIPSGTHGPNLAEKQKLTALLQIYIFTWVLLLASTVAVGKLHIGGVYFVSAWNTAALLGSVVACVQVMLKGSVEGEQVVHDGAGHDDNHREEAVPTEHTPLISRRRRLQPATKSDGDIGWWIFQLLLTVPIPVILLLHIVILLLNATSQTLADGSSPVFVYGATALLAIFLIIPLAPFSFKLHHYLAYFVVVVFIASVVYTWLAFPFSQEAPFKVFFQQQVSLDSNTSQVIKAVTSVTGHRQYLEHAVVSHFPSTWENNVTCGAAASGRRTELWTCKWESGLVPEPGFTWLTQSDDADSVEDGNTMLRGRLRVRTERTGKTAARVKVWGANTRACRLYFDSAQVTRFYVHGASGEGMQPAYPMPSGGLPELRLWSRTWGKTFDVDVEWEEKEGSELVEDGKGLRGRVACEWAEYESGRVGDESGEGGRIPAFEEVLRFLPLWTVVTKANDGLVEAWQNFSV